YKKTGFVITVLGLLSAMVFSGIGCSSAPSIKAPYSDTDPFSDNYVATVRIVISDNDWESLKANAYDKEYYRADFWFDDELVQDVGVRTKGNASLLETVRWESLRFPLAIDFNLFNRARNFHGLKKVHFNNGWSDPTLLRDIISYDIVAQMDIPSPRASLVDLWVNEMHLGVYTMAEAVDKPFLQRHYDNPNGNLYKPEVVSARLDWTEEDAFKSIVIFGMAQPEPEENPIANLNLGGGPLGDVLKAMDMEDAVPALGTAYKSEDIIMSPGKRPHNVITGAGLKTNTNNPNHSSLYRLLDVLNNEPDETFPQEIEKVLDVDEALRFFAVSAGILHLDNYIGIGHNTYLYEVNGKFSLIPWDLNMTFGTFNGGIRKDGIINYYIDEPTAGPMNRFPLVDRLLSHEPYLEKYRGYIQELLDGPFSLEVILPRVDRLAEMVRPYAEKDLKMFYSYEDWERCLIEDLRPPDIFEGWQAGGPSPTMPFFLGAKETSALRTNFGVRNLYELLSYNMNQDDIDKLEEILEEETYHLFLQNKFGPLESPQPPRQSGYGPNSLGLKTIITARWESVRQQLNGERPSGSGYGAGNGASMWIADMYTLR
ncbi:MAG: CotH kinase family protein, partial [Dehalococcoidales bacterium]